MMVWILLHDPVAGVGHDAARDVAGGEPHLIGHTLAEKLLRTDGKHRHADLAALVEQRLVVGGVLAECSKLLEGIVHRMRPCVQGSIVLPRIFIDPVGVSGQLVPEAIEVDTLPALHQTLLVRTPEIEVPQHRVASDVVPIAYSGQRCIDHHPARDPDRILSSQRIADHIADVMCDQVCLLDLECIHDDPDYHRPACDPPSTWSTSPVTWPACARYTTASMTSLTRA